MEYKVCPHILRNGEQVAVANVDGINVLVVPVSEESAHVFISASRLEGVEARPATVEEINALCANYELACVGLSGLEDDMGMDVLSVEVLELALTEPA